MKTILFLIVFSSSMATAKENKFPFRCIGQLSKAAAVAVADTFPVTSAVVDDFVDEGNTQKGDGVFESAAEIMGGAMTFATELGLFLGAAWATEGRLAMIMPLGATKVPYRSTRLQWKKVDRICWYGANR